jgi:AcrR family transcriptional regulator
MLYMRSGDEDRTARAVIRDEALRLFAERGPDAVTVRQVAVAAGVSPALVVHHFGSKEGLRDVVDQHVVDNFEEMLNVATTESPADLAERSVSGSLAELVAQHLPPDSPVPAYLRRMLLTDTDVARGLFARLFRMSRQALDAMVAAGLAAPGADLDTRAAFLMANDLAVLMLRDQLTEVLGVDPLSPAGMNRWAREVLGIYAGGLLGQAREGPTQDGPARPGPTPEGQA